MESRCNFEFHFTMRSSKEWLQLLPKNFSESCRLTFLEHFFVTSMPRRRWLSKEREVELLVLPPLLRSKVCFLLWPNPTNSGNSQTILDKGWPTLPIYSTSKFAVRGMTQNAGASTGNLLIIVCWYWESVITSSALELGKHGITVNAYAPGSSTNMILVFEMWSDICCRGDWHRYAWATVQLSAIITVFWSDTAFWTVRYIREINGVVIIFLFDQFLSFIMHLCVDDWWCHKSN